VPSGVGSAGFHLDQIINPSILYLLCVLGAAGVCLALPRKGVSPQVFGGLLAGAIGGLAMLFLGLKNPEHLPNIYFYVFSVVALGAALRVITHPRPVYAALYFVLTVVATSGLFLILSAEFMAFALVIVYAGAILITYLFVIMLATQSPGEEQVEVLADYDAAAREPIGASVVGFLLLAILTTMMFRGPTGWSPPPSVSERDTLAAMPRKIEAALRNAGTLPGGSRIRTHDETGHAMISEDGLTVRVITPDGERSIALPDGLTPTNADYLGFNLMRDHPGSIEIAGIILLMAMLGAVVLSRKQVQIDEEEKMRHAARLARGEEAGGSA